MTAPTTSPTTQTPGRGARLAVSPVRLLLVAGVLLFPWLPFVSFSLLGTANLAAYYAMVAVSLVVLTGWVGQISLGHAGLVGTGAYVTGHVVEGANITFPANLLWAGAAGAIVAILLGVVALRVRGLYLAVATLIFSWMASEFLFRQKWFVKHSNIEVKPFGEPGTFPYFDWTSRRTYYYAGWAVVAAAIFLAANLRDSKTGRAFFAVRGSEIAAASMGISVVRTKLTAFAVSGAFAGMAGCLLMVRDQVVTSDAFKVEVSLFFLAVAVVGGLSSLGGAVAGALLFAALNEVFFRVEAFSGWLEVVPPVLLTSALLAYRDGLAAVPRAINKRFGHHFEKYIGKDAAWWQSLKAEIGKQRVALGERLAARRKGTAEGAEGELTAEGVAAGAPVRRTLIDRLPAQVQGPIRKVASMGTQSRIPVRRLDIETYFTVPSIEEHQASNGNGNGMATEAVTPSLATVDVEGETPSTWKSIVVPARSLPPNREDRAVLLSAENVTVQFGGLTAVDNVSLTVREHEIVGLIGPNGAGKTTTFNSIAGLNVPTKGRVSIFGQDVTSWPVDERARLGVGRTFQAIQLIPQLSVFDNLLVATHVHNDSGLASHLFVGTATLLAEAEGRRKVRRVAQLLELDQYLDRQVRDLPFGVLRMIEVARAVVTGAPLIMLDEPASGLDNTETDRLSDILRFLRDLGITLLLIEHDVQMVTGVSDYMYVLEYGKLLAEGTPDEIKRDQRVIAAYLGEEVDESAAEAATSETAATETVEVGR